MKKLNIEQMESTLGGWGWHPPIDGLPQDKCTCWEAVELHAAAGGLKGFLGALFLKLYCTYKFGR